LFLLVYHQRKSTEKEKMFEGTESSIHILQYTSTQVLFTRRRRKKEQKSNDNNKRDEKKKEEFT
jgi:hypothetical protein